MGLPKKLSVNTFDDTLKLHIGLCLVLPTIFVKAWSEHYIDFFYRHINVCQGYHILTNTSYTMYVDEIL